MKFSILAVAQFTLIASAFPSQIVLQNNVDDLHSNEKQILDAKLADSILKYVNVSEDDNTMIRFLNGFSLSSPADYGSPWLKEQYALATSLWKRNSAKNFTSTWYNFENQLDESLSSMVLTNAKPNEVELHSKMMEYLELALSDTQTPYNRMINFEFYPLTELVESKADVQKWFTNCRKGPEDRKYFSFNTSTISEIDSTRTDATLTFSFIDLKVFWFKPFSWFDEKAFAAIRKYDTSNALPTAVEKALYLLAGYVAACGHEYKYEYKVFNTKTGAQVDSGSTHHGCSHAPGTCRRVYEHGHFFKQI